MNYNQKDHSHCPSKNSPCGNEGEHRCCLCLKPSNVTQDWKEKVYHIIIHNGTSEEYLKLVVLVESLLKEERLAVLSGVEKEVEKIVENDPISKYTETLTVKELSTTINILRVK